MAIAMSTEGVET